MRKTINEEFIKKIVSESLSKILSESLINELLTNIGVSGKLTPDMLDKPQDLFTQEYKLIDDIKQSGKKIDIPSVFGNTLAYNIWKQYVVAMLGSFNVDNKHRPIPTVKTRKGVDYPKKARGFIGWMEDIRDGKINQVLANGKYPILVYKHGNSYIFGHYMEGFFVACYVSPEANGTINLISELCQYSNVIFMITLDMASVLERAGLYTDGKEYPTPFNGHTVMKKIFGTSQEALEFAIFMEHGSDLIRQLKNMGLSKGMIDKLRNKSGSGNLNDILKLVKNGSTI